VTSPPPSPAPPAAAIAAQVIDRLRVDPPELRERLLPPRFRVEIGTDTVFSYCVRTHGGETVLLVGARQLSLLLQYTRAAAAYFLADGPGGARPSGHWPGARSALATTVDWLAAPASAPLFPEPPLTPRQAGVALAFAESAYRFGVCHELAHVVLDHLGQGPTDAVRAGSDPLERLRASQAQEIEADRLGLMLHIRTLPPGAELEPALASAVYFLHALSLLDLRLMLLARLVDADAWRIEHTHPQSLFRVASLMAAAEGLARNAEAGLSVVHRDLTALDGEVGSTALDQREEVRAAAAALVARHRAPTPAAVDELRRLLERSPTGVLLALEPGAAAAPVPSLDDYAAALPDAFKRFRDATPAERARLA
jgi:hypothetical protein